MTYPVTITRAEAAFPALPWSTFWITAEGLGDWKLAAANDPVNPGGLDASGQLAGAVVISLFTDRRAPEGWRPEVSDRRGWWGDGVAPEGEAIEPIGSHLWLLRNEIVSERNAQLARVYAEEALAWLVENRVAASVAVTTGIIEDPRRGIWIEIVITDRAGVEVFDRRFERVWSEVR